MMRGCLASCCYLDRGSRHLLPLPEEREGEGGGRGQNKTTQITGGGTQRWLKLASRQAEAGAGSGRAKAGIATIGDLNMRRGEEWKEGRDGGAEGRP